MKWNMNILLFMAFSLVFPLAAQDKTVSSAAKAAENYLLDNHNKLVKTKQRKAKRWKLTHTLKDFYMIGTLPLNVNFSFSGKITEITKNPDNTCTASFESEQNISLEDKQKKNVKSSGTIRFSFSETERLALKVGSRKTFTVDGNYVIIYKKDDHIIIHATDNSLTPEPVDDKK